MNVFADNVLPTNGIDNQTSAIEIITVITECRENIVHAKPSPSG
jgi:hypothetical protein